jgi:putative nucleotidyltransferase with HDIG domain
MAIPERRGYVRPEVKTFVVEDTAAERQRRVRDTASRILEIARDSTVKLPMLPETASEAMVLANDPNTPMNKLERTITRDAVLASRMLAVASSAAYAGTPVRTLGAALQRLGTGTVRDILYQSVMECHVFRGDDERSARAERDHAIAVGQLARGICKLVGIDHDYAFVCGLLHDIGRIALASLRKAIADTCAPEDYTAVDDLVHPSLGAFLAGRWKLPSLAIEGARRHHRHAGSDREGYSQMGHVVRVADSIASYLGAGRAPRPLSTDDQAAIFGIGCEPQQLVELARTTVV